MAGTISAALRAAGIATTLLKMPRKTSSSCLKCSAPSSTLAASEKTPAAKAASSDETRMIRSTLPRSRTLASVSPAAGSGVLHHSRRP